MDCKFWFPYTIMTFSGTIEPEDIPVVFELRDGAQYIEETLIKGEHVVGIVV